MKACNGCCKKMKYQANPSGHCYYYCDEDKLKREWGESCTKGYI